VLYKRAHRKLRWRDRKELTQVGAGLALPAEGAARRLSQNSCVLQNRGTMKYQEALTLPSPRGRG
jgi:hypothetical protein